MVARICSHIKLPSQLKLWSRNITCSTAVLLVIFHLLCFFDQLFALEKASKKFLKFALLFCNHEEKSKPWFKFSFILLIFVFGFWFARSPWAATCANFDFVGGCQSTIMKLKQWNKIMSTHLDILLAVKFVDQDANNVLKKTLIRLWAKKLTYCIFILRHFLHLKLKSTTV